jgi:hypothetical protein
MRIDPHKLLVGLVGAEGRKHVFAAMSRYR